MDKLRVLALRSSGTVAALNRIARILRPSGIELVNGFLRSVPDYKYVLVNNRDMASGRHKAILYLCSAGAYRFAKLHDRQKTRKHPYRAIWVNCNSARLFLRAHGLQSTLMYRPNKLQFPSKYAPPSEPRTVLFYWKQRKNHPHHRYLAFCKQFLRRTRDVQFLMFPTDIPIIKAPHVSAIGKLSRAALHQVLSRVAGMIRITPELDFGRVTFNLLSYGRWCIYYNMQERHVHSLPSLRVQQLDHMLHHALDEGDTLQRQRLQYAKETFSETVLTERWTKEFQKVFNL